MSLQPQLAPIVIFCFNRPNHVQKLLESLIQNEEIVSSKLYVFIDGPRQTDDILLMEARTGRPLSCTVWTRTRMCCKMVGRLPAQLLCHKVTPQEFLN